MRTFYECLPCFVNQAIFSLKRCNATDEQFRTTIRSVFCVLAGIDFNTTPPETAQKIYRIITRATGISDPFAEEKKHYNGLAADILSFMKERVSKQQDQFAAKVKLAIAANIIDFGKNPNLTRNDVLACFEKALETSIDENALSGLLQAINHSKKILYLCDNAGEIVFDRLLIEEIQFKKITCAVKAKPVINDATMEDAETVGLSDLVKTISNGSDAPGTLLKECSREFRTVFDESDLIISKGQGNFETLSGTTEKRIFYLLQVKCPVIARDIGYPVGAFVIKDNNGKKIS